MHLGVCGARCSSNRAQRRRRGPDTRPCAVPPPGVLEATSQYPAHLALSSVRVHSGPNPSP